MEKIAEGFYRFKETHTPSRNVNVEMCVEKIDGDECDAQVNLSGDFWVAGQQRSEFLEKLGSLIDEYRI